MHGDFTRWTFQRKKHYRGVNQQQGRVGLDADWNEQSEITAYRAETEALDVIGPSGAPKHHPGFAISVPSGSPNGDFSLGPGRFYVDGILCENEEAVLFTKQPHLPGTSILTQGRYLVYLDVWQRHLTALDDPEIREVALGGPDTATRTKTVWQVRTVPVDAKDGCASESPEWANVITRSVGQLSARAQPDAQSDKPCIVPPGAGYRRLENQLYRVEIHEPGGSWPETLPAPHIRLAAPATFKWSRDNGSIAARIASITGNQITLTTSRKDSALGFAPGQWIEIIDAGLELRGEPGPLARITAVDDLVLTVDTTTVIGTLPATLDMALLPKVRRWDAVGSQPATIPSTNNGFIPLEDGVEVKFEPSDRHHTGDYWLIPARTDKGNIEWPQDSATPSNPLPQLALGIIHHFCRLAIINVASGGAVTVPEDCRRLFPPLTELEDACGCCTKTVGQTGGADYRSIQAAVNSLPATGGQICVLAGTYAEKVEVFGKHNVTIIGCRERTLLGPGLAAGVELGAIIQIKGSTNIRLESLFFRQGLRSAVVVLNSSQVTICECNIAMTKQNGSEPAIFFQGDDGLIERNVIIGPATRILAAPLTVLNTSAAVAERIASTSSTSAPADTDTREFILPEAAANGGQSSAAGTTAAGAKLAETANPASGVQLAGGCDRVRVVENVITNVRGQGITLGNLVQVAVSASSPATATMPNMETARMVFGRWKNPDDECEDCKTITNQIPLHHSRMAPRQTHEIISPLSLWDIHIERNRIQSAGLDGIGVIGFFDLSKQDEFVTVRRLTILGNEIKGCLTLTREPIAPSMVDSMAYGGIALADVYELVIYDNVIEGNGSAQPGQPACGIYILRGDGIDIERNRILGNGSPPEAITGPTGVSTAPPNATRPLGRQGGIHVEYALAPVGASTSIGTVGGDQLGFNLAPFRPGEPTGFPALKLHGNIVSAPVGPALSAQALGPVSVVGNQLTSGRVTVGEGSSVFGPATVSIINLGVSNEAYSQQINFGSFGRTAFQPVLGLDDRRIGDRMANGKIQFADNQCSLDLLEPVRSDLFTSIALSSLDDIGFLNNQCDCNLAFNEDFVYAHAIVVGSSVLVMGNRFTEGWLNAAYSALTAGVVNTTVHNQSTHCLWITGEPTLTTKDPNTILLKTLCGETLATTVSNVAAMRNQQSNS
jgi:hypothetical protein